jgi:hypothetical protein
MGLTFDTGALIGLERRRQRISRVYTTAVAEGLVVTVPAVAICEWWRGLGAFACWGYEHPNPGA